MGLDSSVLFLLLLYPVSVFVSLFWCWISFKEIIMAGLQDAVDAIVVQLGKVKDEIVAEIQALEDAAAAGESLDLSGLTEAAQRLDDIVPDAVAEGGVPAE